MLLKSAILAGALLCALSINAEARQRHRFQPVCIETGTNLQPSCMGNDFLAGVKIRVVLHREGPVHKANKHRHKSRVSALQGPPHHNTYSSNSITRPIRYIAGRLICAINVNACAGRTRHQGHRERAGAFVRPLGHPSGLSRAGSCSGHGQAGRGPCGLSWRGSIQMGACCVESIASRARLGAGRIHAPPCPLSGCGI
jgi:hypothetical protein